MDVSEQATPSTAAPLKKTLTPTKPLTAKKDAAKTLTPTKVPATKKTPTKKTPTKKTDAAKTLTPTKVPATKKTPTKKTAGSPSKKTLAPTVKANAWTCVENRECKPKDGQTGSTTGALAKVE